MPLPNPPNPLNPVKPPLPEEFVTVDPRLAQLITEILAHNQDQDARLKALEGAILAAKGTIKALADLCLEARAELADHCQRFIALEHQVHELRIDKQDREGDHR
jgi:broad specificity phosphatase PhoE